MLGNCTKDCKELIKEFTRGALVWYRFKKDCRILYIYSKSKDEAIESYLMSKGCVTACSSKSVVEAHFGSEKDIRYDYIVGMDVIEECQLPKKLLTSCRLLLKPDGKMLLGVENRYAIKYFCGDRDPYTNHSFDGIENYRRVTSADYKDIDGRCYSKAEIKDMLMEAGFESDKFYSVMPSLEETQLVYSEDYLPVEDLAIRYFPLYNYPDSVFLEEQFLYSDLIKNDMFHAMANAYIVECSLDGTFDNTIHATISMDRGLENALVTSICEHDGERTVCKMAVYPEGIGKLKIIQGNHDDLRSRGINVVDSRFCDGLFVMPYVHAPIAMNKLREIAKRDKDEFLHAMDTFYELILESSEYTDVISEKDKISANGRDLGIILKIGYIDMVLLNCFYDDAIKDSKARFIFYDQEFYIENCPAKAILYRSISMIYDGADKEFEELIPQNELMQRYELVECSDIWQRMSDRFTSQLRNQKELAEYYYDKRCDGRILYTNREKINYNSADYKRIFIDIFQGIDEAQQKGQNVKIVLFGSGIFTHKFLAQFSGEYEIYSIIDNNSQKWGTTIEGIPVNSPDILKDINQEELHLIICIKRYSGVVRQLQDMGITDYHIYDPGNDYPSRRRQRILSKTGATDCCTDRISCDLDSCNNLQDKKPYNVGYIAGVFDLFHIGHLNMFKRAKEMCNYLIVGVVSDEGVRLDKQAEPFVPFEERIEMVRSCRYVDEAVKLPVGFAGTRDMFRVYHFDVQFSGSDYENDPVWLSEKEFLEKNGSTMVFFPYTQSTSSTKLKKAINSKINSSV